MAKTAKSKKMVVKKQRVRARGVGQETLDVEGMKYMNLLRDPCTGPLVHGPGSTEGGSVFRCESDFIMGNGALETCGVFMWAPGAYNTALNPVNGSGTMFNNSATDLTAFNPLATGTSIYAPGYAFLQTNASSYRCLAACIQIYWPGSELNRQGIVGVAQGTYGAMSTNINLTVAQVRGACPITQRMPSDRLEAKWAPHYADGLFRNASNTQIPEDGHGSLIVNWAGIPVATGVRLRLVAVFEWRPKLTTGAFVLSSNTEGGSRSSATIQSVRQYLDRMDSHWWISAALASAKFFSGATTAYRTIAGRTYPRATISEL